MTATAQSRWTLGVGMDNVILYGGQYSYLPGVRLGFDYRYDFPKGYGVGIETGLWLRYAGRRYSDVAIIGGEPEEIASWGGEIESMQVIYSRLDNFSFSVPLHLSYTHLFYQDWSLTGFVGTSIDYMHYDDAFSVYWVQYVNGSVGTIYGAEEQQSKLFDLPLEFGLGLTYRHLQLKLGSSLSLMRRYDCLRFDGSSLEEHLSRPLSERICRPADLYLTVGYRF